MKRKALEKEAARLRAKLDAGESSADERRQLMAIYEDYERAVVDEVRAGTKTGMYAEMVRSQRGFLQELEKMTLAASTFWQTFTVSCFQVVLGLIALGLTVVIHE